MRQEAGGVVNLRREELESEVAHLQARLKKSEVSAAAMREAISSLLREVKTMAQNLRKPYYEPSMPGLDALHWEGVSPVMKVNPHDVTLSDGWLKLIAPVDKALCASAGKELLERLERYEEALRQIADRLEVDVSANISPRSSITLKIATQALTGG